LVTSMKMTNEEEINPIWAHYCATQMEDWLTWLGNVHTRSYVELCERFIELHQNFTLITHPLPAKVWEIASNSWKECL